MGSSPPPLQIRLSRAELAEDLAEALSAGDCLCARTGERSLVVVHRAATDESEARIELGFFLRAWEQRHADVRAELV